MMNKLIHFTSNDCLIKHETYKNVIDDFLKNNDIEYEFIDVSKDSEKTKTFDVKNIPYFISIKNNRIHKRESGVPTFSLLQGLFDSSGIYSEEATNNQYYQNENLNDLDPKKIFSEPHIFNNNIVIDNVSKKIGLGIESIKIIKNFISNEDLEILEPLCDSMYRSKIQPEEKIKLAEQKIIECRNNIKSKAEELFGLKLEEDDSANKYNIESKYLNGRQPYYVTDIHTDLVGDDSEKYKQYGWSGRISNLIYLNEDYEGGELYFPHHNLKIKPEKGMLVSFPGHWYNRHGIMPASNLRLAINVFLKISNFENLV